MSQKWNSERLLSAAAIGISFLTLIIFVYQTRLLSRQNYISIMPYLMLSTTNSTDEHIFELNLKNHGVGPAIIESVILEYKRKRYNLIDYNHETLDFLATLQPGLAQLKNSSTSTLNPGLAIPANSSYNVLRIRNSPEDYQLITTALDELLRNGFRYQVIYRSIQNERWLIDNLLQGPEKLK